MRMIVQIRYLGLMICIVCHSVLAQQNDYDLNLSASILSGKLDGYLQTPDGGLADTSDRHRPTFDEFDIDDANQIDLMFRVSRGKHSYSLGAMIIDLHENTVLAQPLLTQWQTFQPGDPVVADIQLNWYRLGYAYKFSGLFDSPLDLAVGSDISTFDFHYQLDGPTQQVDRAYGRTALRGGLELTYPVAENLKLRLTAYSSFPSSTHSILTVDLNAEYSLWEGDTAGSLLLGISYHRIDYQDDQTIPNHIRAEMGPLLRLGFTFGIR